MQSACPMTIPVIVNFVACEKDVGIIDVPSLKPYPMIGSAIRFIFVKHMVYDRL